MKEYGKFAFVLLVCIVLSASLVAQQSPTAKQLVGTWKMVSITLDKNGQKTDMYGPNPQGITIVDRNGHFSRLISRSDVPKFASNNRTGGTPEENKAAVQGSIAYYGTYTCNPADKGCTLHIEGCSFPNWIGTDQKHLYTLIGDELRESNPAPSTGAGSAQVIWKRVR